MVVVAISGLPGTGSSTVGRMLASKLGVEFFSAGKWYKERGKGKSETEKAIDYLSSEEGTSLPTNKSLDDLQVELAKKGDIVIDAKAGIHFLKDIADLKVWLMAGFDVRVERVAVREKWDLNVASEKLKEKEKLEKELFMKVYGIDYLLQEKEADLVLNVSSINGEEIVENIVEMLRKKQVF
jgi:cytidylate kinase